jgi:hypothetical protein
MAPAANRTPPPQQGDLAPRRGEPTPPPPLAMPAMQGMPGPAERSSGLAPMSAHMSPTGLAPTGLAQSPLPLPVMTPIGSPMFVQQATPTPTPTPTPYFRGGPGAPGAPPALGPMGTYPQYPQYPQLRSTQKSSRKFVWWVIALLAVGAGVGTALALLFSK